MKEPTTQQLEEQLHALFAEHLDDSVLQERIHALAGYSVPFAQLIPVWGPPLYRRNRAMFLPFILGQFWWWSRPRWRGKYQEALEQWLADADRLDDVVLFQHLHRWKVTSLYWWPASVWRREFVERFRKAKTAADRAQALSRYDLGYPLDDQTALALYDIDANTVRTFLVHRVQGSVPQLRERARQAADEELLLQLYRRLVKKKDWQTDVLALCDQIADPAQLCQELETHHPWSVFGSDLGVGFLALYRRRGADVVPYVQNHLAQVRFAPGKWYPALRDLALENGLHTFHCQLIRLCSAPEEFQKTVVTLLQDSTQTDDEVISQLYLLTGITAGQAQCRYLDDPTARAIYRRFPDLVRSTFRPLVYLPWTTDKPSLLDEVLAANDEVMIDHLAAQVISRVDDKDQQRLADYYVALRDRPQEFTRRAGSVLGRLPSYAIHESGYRSLIQRNRLARLFLERSADLHLTDPTLLRNLLESPSIYVQILALRILALDDERARQSAAEHLDLLLPVLLRPLHRRTRLLAFKAIANAATTEDRARLILARSRETMELPDPHYPREPLIGLMGKLLARWPNLRQTHEQPIVYQREAS